MSDFISGQFWTLLGDNFGPCRGLCVWDRQLVSTLLIIICKKTPFSGLHTSPWLLHCLTDYHEIFLSVFLCFCVSVILSFCHSVCLFSVLFLFSLCFLVLFASYCLSIYFSISASIFLFLFLSSCEVNIYKSIIKVNNRHLAGIVKRSFFFRSWKRSSFCQTS